jgi:hypothetical protein
MQEDPPKAYSTNLFQQSEFQFFKEAILWKRWIERREKQWRRLLRQKQWRFLRQKQQWGFLW